MIELDIIVRRPYFDISIEEYEEWLKKKLAQLKDTFEIREALVNEGIIKKMISVLEDELKYCEFHKNMAQLRTETGFNTWVFTEQKDVKTLYPWNEPEGDEWTRTNGRIKATIRIIKKQKTTSVQLIYKNDNSILTFTDSIEGKKTHLRKEESINRCIEELKAEADKFLSTPRKMYPSYNSEITNLLKLNRILFIEN